ncbi:hypothetical protein L9F63_017685 [Diploptera punctata]|uniref:CHHC U11-48K-type domain-containing protein n=1 Tax=Diploptera punctata TaxID=6984 RepID=A0AAD7ZYK7_DIPPU|nr:hypothetical protein L9F63_017685 [Diploptera punctata]
MLVCLSLLKWLVGIGPLNNEHYVPKDKLERHIASCSWRMEGYHDDAVPLPESSCTDGSSIVIDKELQTAIIKEELAKDTSLKTGIPAMGLDNRPIPKTADRLISDFTVDERRILYDYKEEKERPKTYLERLAAERDAKRRKVGKKVHTNRKSQIEVCISYSNLGTILREVIQNQMELYEEHLKLQFPELKYKDEDSDHSAGPSRDDKRSPSRKRENLELSNDDYKHRNEYHTHCSSYEGSRYTPEPRSHRRSEYERNEEYKSHRDRKSSSYKESRVHKRKHSREERESKRKRENLEHIKDDYKHRNECYTHHSSHEGSRHTSESRSHRRSENDRNEEFKSHRHRKSSSYDKESHVRSRKHTHEERDNKRVRDDRGSAVHEYQRKQYSDSAYDYD